MSDISIGHKYNPNADPRSQLIVIRQPSTNVHPLLMAQVYRSRFMFPVYFTGERGNYYFFRPKTALDEALEEWTLSTKKGNARLIHDFPGLNIEPDLIRDVYTTRYPQMVGVLLSPSWLLVYV